jgi:hypothetical protein
MNNFEKIEKLLSGKLSFRSTKTKPVKSDDYTSNLTNLNQHTKEGSPLLLNRDHRNHYQHFGGFQVPQSKPLNKAAVGVPGSGKTEIIYQNLRSCLERVTRHSMNTVVCLDTKRDVLPIFALYAATNNVPLIYYDLNDARGADWNLIADTQGDFDRIHELSCAFIKDTAEPVWGQGTRLINDAIILSCIHTKGLHATLYDMYETARLPLTELTEALNKSPDASNYAKRLLDTEATEFRDSLLMNHFIEIDALRKGALHSLNTSDERRFTIQQLLSQPCMVLVTCDASVEHSAFPLMRAFLTNLITQVRALPDLKYSPYPQRRISLFLDEVHAIGKVPNLDKAFSTGRSKGLEVILSFHDMGQMRKVYDEATLKNMTNCLDYIAMFRCTDPETAEWFVKRGGIERITDTSSSVSEGANGGSYSEGTRTLDRSRFTTDDILWMQKADEETGSHFYLFHPYGKPLKVNLPPHLYQQLAPLEDRNCPIFIPKSQTDQGLPRSPRIAKNSFTYQKYEQWVIDATTPLERTIRLYALSYINQLVDSALDELIEKLGGQR